MAASNEPNRVYLYDLTHNRPLVDYYLDATNASDAKKSKYVFSGLINKEAVTNGRGQTYKVRITNQIRNLVKHTDSTNVKLGLVVTENICEIKILQ
jgi:lipase chaperone LimK